MSTRCTFSFLFIGERAYDSWLELVVRSPASGLAKDVDATVSAHIVSVVVMVIAVFVATNVRILRIVRIVR